MQGDEQDLNPIRRCGAKTRNGGTCRNDKINPKNGRCRMHGGWGSGAPATTLDGIARQLEDKAKQNGSISQAIQRYLDDPNLRSLDRTMAFCHAMQDSIELTYPELDLLNDDQRQHVLEVMSFTANVIEKVSKIENANQLTAAQVALLQVRIREASKFVEPSKREAYLQFLINSEIVPDLTE